jgi:hypothetical protein
MPLISCQFSALLKDREGFELNAPITHRPVIRRYALVYYYVSLIQETGMLLNRLLAPVEENFLRAGPSWS